MNKQLSENVRRLFGWTMAETFEPMPKRYAIRFEKDGRTYQGLEFRTKAARDAFVDGLETAAALAEIKRKEAAKDRLGGLADYSTEELARELADRCAHKQGDADETTAILFETLTPSVKQARQMVSDNPDWEIEDLFGEQVGVDEVLEADLKWLAEDYHVHRDFDRIKSEFHRVVDHVWTHGVLS